jgi:hypothetical protein
MGIGEGLSSGLLETGLWLQAVVLLVEWPWLQVHRWFGLSRPSHPVPCPLPFMADTLGMAKVSYAPVSQLLLPTEGSL